MEEGVVSSNEAGRRRARRRWACMVPVLIGGAWLAVAAGSRAATQRVYLIPSNSMAPTLRPGDRMTVQGHPGRVPRQGEIWVLRAPPAASRLPAEFVKRVMGLPGETVEIREGVLWIDGRRIAEPYLTRPFTYSMPPRTLGAGEYFVLGDDRDASNDSHRWGPLPEQNFIGPVNYRIWPPRRIGGL